MANDLRVLVVGGGIGGLSTVLALRQAGIPATAYEQAASADRTVLGGGMTLFQNAMSVLQRLGVADRVEAVGREMHGMEHRAARGLLLDRWPIAEIAKETGYPAIALSRADLQATLVEAAGADVHTNARLDQIVADDDGVTARFADGETVRADLLVGADGIRSFVRAHLHGPSEPRYLGYAIWQAIIDEPEALGPQRPDFLAWWGPGTRAGYYRIGGGRVYWYAVENAPAGHSVPADHVKKHLLGIAARYEKLMTTFVELTDPATITRSDVYDRPPLVGWGRGRVTLLGDAAHAMSFNVGQGACQAIEDAWALRHHLARGSNVEAALRSYEAEREPKTAPLVARAAMVGRLGQKGWPLTWARNLSMMVAFRAAAYGQHRDAAMHLATD